VALLGSNPTQGIYEQHIEIYSPRTCSTRMAASPRPSVTGVSPTITYGGTFQVQTPEAADIASVVVMRPGAPTHAFDMDQRS